MGFEQNRDQIAFLYFLMKRNPGLEHNQALQKMKHYSKKRVNTEMYWSMYPEQSPTFKRRELMNMYGAFSRANELHTEDIEE